MNQCQKVLAPFAEEIWKGYEFNVTVAPFITECGSRAGNNLAEQQVNNNNKEKTKQQMQDQLSSPLSQVLETYDCGNFENCEPNTEIILIYH